MNNEPVAWMVKNRDSGIGYVQTEEPTRTDKVANEYLPLYTHPAKTEDEGKVCARCGAIAYDPVIKQTAKTLTDEEILDIAHQIRLVDKQTVDDGHLYFARAILKKASEK
jgi:hypothetical protein